ncbi:hypothetical protein A946_07375 [Methylacidiphilum kamchatkense Kam1]|uniref:Uncharacterized protein n=1 Tax=Methylacidiphilum kamchatkense Kam1 TaxID=1202785 RepID=A0A0C1UPI8_9BACT|nr:hypothetical protein [Methylacidiphilum kamchatkense]KIE58309.1 hypothetical protein A946_07375 [Methylacidiphilum kamchatkense Kam1]QDQ42288.1 hypothetical protein kam1_1058 [Methylacidiphilum kamchatkense Kam1]
MLKIVPWSFGRLAVAINLSMLARQNYGLEIKELLAINVLGRLIKQRFISYELEHTSSKGR